MAATAYTDFRDDAGRPVSGLLSDANRRAEAALVARLRAKGDGKRAVQRALKTADERDFESYKRELRQKERRSGEPGEDIAERDDAEFLRSDPGYPLGPHFPPGRSLRADGESHRKAWTQVIKRDPCSYCGRAGGTVDHVVPRARGGRDVWTNYAGACGSCNSTKSDTPMLLWLAHRGVLT